MNIVVASLAAIAAILSMVFDNQQEARLRDLRGQGVSLARALSAVPYEQIVAGGEQQGVIQILRRSTSDNGFAYVSVQDREGRTMTELAAAR